MINSAAHADAGAKHLLDSASQLARAAPVAHDPRNLDHLVQFQVATVLDVLLLQAYKGTNQLPLSKDLSSNCVHKNAFRFFPSTVRTHLQYAPQ